MKNIYRYKQLGIISTEIVLMIILLIIVGGISYYLSSQEQVKEGDNQFQETVLESDEYEYSGDYNKKDLEESTESDLILELTDEFNSEDENNYQHYRLSFKVENVSRDTVHNVMCRKENEDFSLKELSSYGLSGNIMKIYHLALEPDTNYVCYVEECLENECRKSNEISFKTIEEYFTTGGSIDVTNRIYTYNDEQYIIGEDVEIFLYENKVQLNDICHSENDCSNYRFSLHVLFNKEGRIEKIFYTPQ